MNLSRNACQALCSTKNFRTLLEESSSGSSSSCYSLLTTYIVSQTKEKMGRGGEDADSKIPEDAIVVAHTGSEESEVEVHRNASHRDALKRHIDEANPMRSPRNASKQSGHGVHGAPPVTSLRWCEAAVMFFFWRFRIMLNRGRRDPAGNAGKGEMG